LQVAVTEQAVERRLEHRVRVEREAASRACHVLERRCAPSVHEHRTAGLPCFEQHERERLERRRRDQRGRPAEERPLRRLVDLADLHDVGVLGHGPLHRPDDGERERTGAALLVAREQRDEQVRPLAVIDAAQAHEVRPPSERASVCRGGSRGGRVDAETDDDLWLRDRRREELFGDGALPLAVERDGLLARRAPRDAESPGRRRAGGPRPSGGTGTA
jgi:hypothetical protein